MFLQVRAKWPASEENNLEEVSTKCQIPSWWMADKYSACYLSYAMSRRTSLTNKSPVEEFQGSQVLWFSEEASELFLSIDIM